MSTFCRCKNSAKSYLIYSFYPMLDNWKCIFVQKRTFSLLKERGGCVVCVEHFLAVANYNFFLFNTIHTIMGAPKTAVTALIGKVLPATGICETISHVSRRILPNRRVAGRIVL